MLTKDQILEESKHFLGQDNNLLKKKQIKRRDLIELLVHKELFSSFEERACLKKELKRRKIKFNKEATQYELVQLAMKKRIDFNEFIL